MPPIDETDDQDLTAPEPFDMLEVYARATEAAEADPDEGEADDAVEEPGGEALVEGEDGPNSTEEGELPEADDAVVEEPEDEEKDEEESPTEGDEAQSEEPDEVAQLRASVERLTALAQERQQDQHQLLQLLTNMQQKATAPPSAPPPRPDGPSDEALELAMFGTTIPDGEERWNALSPVDRDKARQFVQKNARAEARYARDPQARYRDQIQQHVQQEIDRVVGPLLAERKNVEAKALYDDAVKDLEPAEITRLQGLWHADSRSKSPQWEDQKLALDSAVAQVGYEKKAKALDKKSLEVTTEKRQVAANRKASRGSSRKTKGSARGKKQRPPFKRGDDLVEYARRIRETEE